MEPTDDKPAPSTPPATITAADLRRLGYEATAEDGWVVLSPASADAVLAVLLDLRYPPRTCAPHDTPG